MPNLAAATGLKVLERQVHNGLMQHLLSNDLLSDRQFGFRPGCSTMEAILACTGDWHDVMERGGSVACVFFDLSKAFDTPAHSLVLSSLARVGVCGTLLRCFHSYLSGRSQRVVLKGTWPQSHLALSLIYTTKTQPLLILYLCCSFHHADVHLRYLNYVTVGFS